MTIATIRIPSESSDPDLSLKNHRSSSRCRRFLPLMMGWIVLATLGVVETGCSVLHTDGIQMMPSVPWSGGGFLAASTSATPKETEGQYADSLLQEEKPGLGSYVLYTFVGAPRDLIATVLEPAGYGVGAVGGVVLNVLAIPATVLYSGEYKVERPVSRGCVMAMACPFFYLSDFFCRSFTGDTNRYRWGVHPFPRADHRFFPNYHAILED